MSKKHSKRYVFTLIGVNINKVDQKYGIVSMPILDEDNNIPNNTTKIDDLEIIDIPDDVKWHIAEYGGTEWIAEDHRTWS
jgi:hypothetical protein